jgi:hypothetical protein
MTEIRSGHDEDQSRKSELRQIAPARMNALPDLRTLVCSTATLLAIGAVRTNASPPAAVWSVVALREPTAQDIPFEERTGYLRPSEDANSVAGPDGLRAVVRNDAQSHPHIYVDDPRAGTSSVLLDAWACLPQWSPDGRWIACSVWRSMGHPYELTIVDARAKAPVIDPDDAASGTNMKWSPDSRTIAAAGPTHHQPWTFLYTVSIPNGAVSVLDSCAIFADYDFSWSPNGRWIAFARTTEVDPIGGDPIAADLWVVEPATGAKQQLLTTPDWIEAGPLWITDRAILIEQMHWNGDDWEGERQRVVELTPP